MSTDQLRTVATGVKANPLATLQGYFTTHRKQLEAALPAHLKADRMARLALTSMSQNPKLMECDPKSVFGSVITASQLGLEIGVLGQGYLVPYKKTCQFIPGWQGLVDLVSRAGRATVWTGAVFQGDAFDYQLGDSPFARHKPSGEDDPRLLTHVYAIGRVNGSEWPVIEVWPIARVWKHRDRYNKVGSSHYSYGNEEMYARKVVLLQVLKYVPKSIELQNAMTVNEAHEAGQSTIIDGDFVKVDDEDQEQPTEGAVVATVEPKPSPQASVGTAGRSSPPPPPPTSPPAGAAATPAKAEQQAPAAKSKGTAKARDDFMARMKEAKDIPGLTAIAQESSTLEWSDAMFSALNDTYFDCEAALQPKGEAVKA